MPKETATIIAKALDIGLDTVCFVNKLNYHNGEVGRGNLTIAYR